MSNPQRKTQYLPKTPFMVVTQHWNHPRSNRTYHAALIGPDGDVWARSFRTDLLERQARRLNKAFDLGRLQTQDSRRKTR